MNNIQYKTNSTAHKQKVDKVKKSVIIGVFCALLLVGTGKALVSNVYGADNSISQIYSTVK